jgi:universal stress protein A
MAVYQHILAAVDLGENSTKVLQHAAPLAEICDARLTVLHVVNYIPASDIDYLIPPAEANDNKLIETARLRLHELLEREALTSGVETMIVSGRAKVEIARVAEEQHADLIVVGAHGRHGLAGVLGSTAERVLHRVNCDVLTVR